MTWEERWHPLREEWVLVAAHRQNRPWSGETIETEARAAQKHLKETGRILFRDILAEINEGESGVPQVAKYSPS